MCDNEVVDISNDDWAKVISDPDEYKDIIMNLLKNDSSEIGKEVYKMLGDEDKYDPNELDMKLRTLSTIVPYNMLVPLLREQLGLSIQTDKDCVESLNIIKSFLISKEDKNTIDQIVGFINDEDLDDSIVPEIDLLGMIDQLPVEKFPALLNCIDYVIEVSEFLD